MLPPVVCILPFFPSQETPVEAVVKLAQVRSMCVCVCVVVLHGLCVVSLIMFLLFTS